MSNNQTTLALALLLAVGAALPAAAQDAANGEKEFTRRCGTCHSIGGGPKKPAGPDLTGVIGRKAGTMEGFNYSTLNKNAGEAGLIWTEAHINDYLPNPNDFLKKFLTDAGKTDQIKGATRMPPPPGGKDEKVRADLIAFIKTHSK
jgi:cytochrome c